MKDSVSIKKFEKKKINRKINFDEIVKCDENKNYALTKKITKEDLGVCNSSDNSVVIKSKINSSGLQLKSVTPSKETPTKLSKINERLISNDSFVKIPYEVINNKERDLNNNQYLANNQNNNRNKKRDETFSDLSDAGNKTDISNIVTNKQKSRKINFLNKLNNSKNLNESNISNINLNHSNNEQIRKNKLIEKNPTLNKIIEEKIKTPERIIKKTNFENYKLGNKLKFNDKIRLDVNPNDISNNIICSISDFSKSPINNRKNNEDSKRYLINNPKLNNNINKYSKNDSNNKSNDSFVSNDAQSGSTKLDRNKNKKNLHLNDKNKFKRIDIKSSESSNLKNTKK